MCISKEQTVLHFPYCTRVLYENSYSSVTLYTSALWYTITRHHTCPASVENLWLFWIYRYRMNCFHTEKKTMKHLIHWLLHQQLKQLLTLMHYEKLQHWGVWSPQALALLMLYASVIHTSFSVMYPKTCCILHNNTIPRILLLLN